MCRSKQPADRRDKDTTSGQRIGSVQETVDSNDDYSSDSSGYLHNILQLGTRANKFLLTVDINSIPIEMEVDSGAERSTVPLSLFEQRLSSVCKLRPSRVSLYQYDKSPLRIQNYCQNQQSRHLRHLCGSRCAETVPSFGKRLDGVVKLGPDFTDDTSYHHPPNNC